MIKDVPYKGYATEPSDYECADGQLAMSLNLINEDNQLKPVFQPATHYTLPSGAVVVAIHKTTTTEQYIVLASGSLYWFVKYDDSNLPATLTMADMTLLMALSGATLYKVEPVGNTLVILASDGIHYVLWKENTYNSLGQHMPEIDISFSMVYTLHYSEGLQLDSRWGNYCDVNNKQDFTDEDKIAYNNLLHGAINKLIAEQVTGKGKFNMPFLVRFAYRLYDGNLTMHSAPVLMLPNGIQAYMDSNQVKLIVYANALQCRCLVPAATLANWKDIITSVDIFVSAPMWTYDAAKDVNNVFGKTYRLKYVYCFDDNNDRPYQIVGRSDGSDNDVAIPQFDRATVEEKICECAQFFLLKSIKIENLPTTRTKLDIPDDYLQSLVTRELMTDDYFSHDALVPTIAYNFNGRINMANLSRRLFDGFTPFTAFMHNNDEGSVNQNKLRVEIVRDGKTIVVEKANSIANTYFNKDGVTFFFYPDPQATRAWLYQGTDCYYMPLTAHNGLNGAYFFNLDGPQAATGTVPDVTTDKNIRTPNKIYTSEVNNPFFFPVLGINTVGTGEILGICSAVKALSQGQFGQFPLYAFTTEGVWALEVSATGTFTARQPVTRDVCTNPDSITQIDDAVLFATHRGIMHLKGSQTTCITDTIFAEHPFNVLGLPCIDQLHTKLGHSADACIPVKPFLEFLDGCRMIYDYVHQHIIVFNPKKNNGTPLYTYAYVFSLKSSQWGMMYSVLQSTVNAYPDALAMTDAGNLVSFASTDETQCKGLFVTRPIKLDAADVHKTISAIIQRGHFQRGDVGTVLYGSRDLYDWQLVWSSRDHYLRGFRGTPYKYLRIAGLTQLTDGKSIFGASMEYEMRHTNNLR